MVHVMGRQMAIACGPVGRTTRLFEGSYEAARAAALSGVPGSTVYDWARKEVVVPTVSRARPMLWSYANLMELRIVYWLRHRKSAGDRDVPASPMAEVREALELLELQGVDLWSASSALGSSLVVTRQGEIIVVAGDAMSTSRGQGVFPESLDILGPFDVDGDWGPDLRRPMPHLRIVPGKVSGEPHLVHSRLTTQAVAALAGRGFTTADIRRLYPSEDPEGLSEAVELERRLAA
jgi:uncharacterized protein (DUF433 family)